MQFGKLGYKARRAGEEQRGGAASCAGPAPAARRRRRSPVRGTRCPRGQGTLEEAPPQPVSATAGGTRSCQSPGLGPGEDCAAGRAPASSCSQRREARRGWEPATDTARRSPPRGEALSPRQGRGVRAARGAAELGGASPQLWEQGTCPHHVPKAPTLGATPPPRLRGARCPLPSLQPPPQMERKGSTWPDPAQQHRTGESHLADVPLQGQRAPWCQQVPGKSQILSLRRGCQRGATQTPHPAPAGTNAAAKRSPQGWSRAKLLDKTSVRPSVRPSQSCPCLCPISPLGSSSAGGAGREAGAAARCSRGCESFCTAAAAGERSPARPFPLPGWWWGLQGIFIIFWGGERMKGKLRKEPFPRSLWGGGISKSCHVSQEERGSVWCPPHTAAAAFGKGRGKVGRD